MPIRSSAPIASRLLKNRRLVATAVAAAIAGSAMAPAFSADDLEEVAVTGSRIQRTRDLEAAYVAMWNRQHKGLPPASFTLGEERSLA